MRYNRVGKKYLYTPALPKQHQVYSTDVTRLFTQIVPQLQTALGQLKKQGVLGDDDQQRFLKDLLSLSRRMNDFNKRERLTIASKIQEDFGETMEDKPLNELKANPDRTPFIPNTALRQRLRSCQYNVLDFVDSMVEGLKRLRYSNYITEQDYRRYRQVMEMLPGLRVEILDMLEKYGDG